MVHGRPAITIRGILETVEFDSNDNCTNKLELLHPMLQYGNAPTAWNASSGDYLTQESAKSLLSQTADGSNRGHKVSDRNGNGQREGNRHQRCQ